MVQGDAHLEIRLDGEFQPAQHIQHDLLIAQQGAADENMARHATEAEAQHILPFAHGQAVLRVEAGALREQVAPPCQVAVQTRFIQRIRDAGHQLLHIVRISVGVHLEAQVHAQTVTLLRRFRHACQRQQQNDQQRRQDALHTLHTISSKIIGMVVL